VKRLLKCIFLVTWSTGSKIEKVYFYVLKIFFTAPWLCNISSIPGCALIMDQRFEHIGCRMTLILPFLKKIHKSWRINHYS